MPNRIRLSRPEIPYTIFHTGLGPRVTIWQPPRLENATAEELREIIAELETIHQEMLK